VEHTLEEILEESGHILEEKNLLALEEILVDDGHNLEVFEAVEHTVEMDGHILEGIFEEGEHNEMD